MSAREVSRYSAADGRPAMGYPPEFQTAALNKIYLQRYPSAKEESVFPLSLE